MPEKRTSSDNSQELKWLQGNAADFTRIYTRYQPLLFGIARSYMDDSAVASDMVQDVFLKLWNKRAELKIDDLRSYLFGMVRNRCMDHHRSLKRTDELHTAESLEAAEEADHAIEARETGKQLNDLIRALSPQCRTVFLLVRFEGLPYKEVAEILNISAKTVENHMGRALKTLREGMKEGDGSLNSLLLFALFTADLGNNADFFQMLLGVRHN
ncbi:MAG: RNA polymerase sigma factor [Bacteroidia bacterium]